MKQQWEAADYGKRRAFFFSLWVVFVLFIIVAHVTAVVIGETTRATTQCSSDVFVVGYGSSAWLIGGGMIGIVLHVPLIVVETLLVRRKATFHQSGFVYEFACVRLGCVAFVAYTAFCIVFALFSAIWFCIGVAMLALVAPTCAALVNGTMAVSLVANAMQTGGAVATLVFTLCVHR